MSTLIILGVSDSKQIFRAAVMTVVFGNRAANWNHCSVNNGGINGFTDNTTHFQVANLLNYDLVPTEKGGLGLAGLGLDG